MNRLQKLLRRRKYRLRRSMYNHQNSGALSLELLDEDELFPVETPEPIKAAAAPAPGIDEAVVAELKQQHQKQLEELAAQLKEAQELTLRSRADLENQRRRFQKEKDDLRKYAKEELMRELVNPMDHFAIALQSLEAASDLESVRKGVLMIHREFVMVLKQSGLVELNPLGEIFNPNLHDAVSTEDLPDHQDGVILKVNRPGWELKGRVLRPAMVHVNRRKAHESTQRLAAILAQSDDEIEIEFVDLKEEEDQENS